MPRPLAQLAGLLTCLALAGCASAPEPVNPVEQPQKAQVLPVQRWLRWQETVATMTPEQLDSALEGMARPATTGQLFYYGLLRQQTDAYDGWVAARDIFRDLRQNASLSASQQHLAALLERYNQSRINWFHSREELRQQYQGLEAQRDLLQEQNNLLEQKIQAITDLESTISTRQDE